MGFTHSDNTPMTQLNPVTVLKNQEAFARLLDQLPLDGIEVIYETCAGIGLQTECLLRKLPGVPMFSNDISKDCVDVVRGKFPSLNITTLDRLDFLEGKPMDRALLVYDMNNTTFHPSRRENVEDGMARRPDIVMSADLGKGKLHLNYRSYGLEKGATVEDYMAAWRTWAKERGWVHYWESSVRSICYMAFVREDRA